MQVKATVFGFLCVCFSNTLYADYDVADLEKLFTDKQQRARIDALRSGRSTNPGLKKAKRVSVQGYVTRSNGKSVAWINNSNTLEKKIAGGVNVNKASIGKNKKVVVSVDGRNVKLKPGETWHAQTGRIVDNQ